METRVITIIHENYRRRHLLNTSWCPITFVLVEAESADNWSIARKQGALRSIEKPYWKSPQRSQTLPS